MQTTKTLQDLIAAHPLLFRGEPPPIASHLPPGWYTLVDELCTDIERTLGPQGCAQFQVQQIKEKFAGLRFYYRFGDAEDVHVDILGEDGLTAGVVRAQTRAPEMQVLRTLVDRACETSQTTCVRCGAPGQVRSCGGCFTTLCEAHHASQRDADDAAVDMEP